MLKNNRKMAISKIFLISLCIVCLMFTSFGFFIEDSFAADLNESVSVSEMGSEIDIESVENSQENEVLEVETNDSQVLSATHTVSGNSFSDIRTAVRNSGSGDTIKLSGTYYSDGNSISINKKVTIDGGSKTVLDAKHLFNIFYISPSASGTVIKNLKCINGEAYLGSAIRINATNVVIDNCVFEDNHAIKGGAVYAEYNLYATEGLTVKNCNFTRNTAYFENFNGSSNSGALGLYSKNSKVINCIFDSNLVKSNGASYGGAIQVGLDLPESNVQVIGCTFKNNKAISIKGESHGGAGCIREGSVYTDCVFIGNSADMGGALTMHSSGKIENCSFYDNVATSKYGGAVSTGLVYDTMNLEINNCIFESNTAPEGGAIQLKGENVRITNSRFNNNQADQYGGAITIDAENVEVHDSKFNSNIANVNGGAIYIKGKNTLVENSSFVSNEAIPDVTKLNDGLGGAIYINSKQAKLKDNDFIFNVARNGSAIYYDESGEKLTLVGNTLYQNQAWVYGLPISAEDIYYTESENIKVTLYGGNNIADFDNLAVSNAIYNNAENNRIEINGEYPVNGATNTGVLYQDDREYNINILLTVQHEDGTVVYNKSLNTSYLGEISVDLDNLKAGKYSVVAKHFEDTYYKGITNLTSFRVIPKVDLKVTKSTDSSSFNFEDIVVWTLNVTNYGPSNATGVKLYDPLPAGLIWLNDDSEGKYNHKTGILSIDNLTVGENMVFRITTLINKTGEIVNSANVTSNEEDSNISDNYAEKTISVNPAADLAIVKSINNISPNYGDYVTWTIEVSNNGPDDAHDVIVKDILSKSLIYLESDGNYDHSSGIWTITTLENGAKIKLNIRCKIDKTGLIENNASVAAKEYDYDELNNNCSKFIYVSPTSDLEITKKANSTNANYGDLVKWTLTVTNNGPDEASDVNVEDILPEGFIFVSSSHSYSNGIFAIDTLGVGEKIIIDIISRVNATGNFTNVAKVSCNGQDLNQDNNMANASVSVNPACDLVVEKSVDENEPDYHDEVVWTIKVTNIGPDTANGIVVRDLLPSSLVWIEDDGSGNYNPNTGLWDISQLDADESIELNIRCLVNGTGLIENNVSVSSDEYDLNLTNNHDSETVNVETSSDVAIAKSVNNTNPNYGDLVKWTLTVTNNGPDAASDVNVEDILPEGFIFVSSSHSYSDGVFSIGRLAAGEKVIIDIITRVNASGNFTNVAAVSIQGGDPDLDNNEANASVNVNPACDLAVVKSVSESAPSYHDEVVWTIEVSNRGPDAAHDVVVRDLLLSSLVWIEDDSLGKYDPNTGVWSISQLGSGESLKLNIKCLVNGTGLIENNVSISANEFDLNLTNNNDTESVNVESFVDVSIAKSVNNTNPNYGDVIKWTLTITNNGPDKATDIYVTEALPSGLIFVEYNSTKGIYYDDAWVMCCLEKGEVQSIDIICIVNKTGKITNFAQIEAKEQDLNSQNNIVNKSIDVPPCVDLEVHIDVNNSKPLFGETVTWMISVKNNGPDNATNVKLYETLPDGLIFLKSAPNKGEYSLTRGRSAVHTWDIGSLNTGESAYLNITTKVNTLGSIRNDVNVESAENDINMSNNNDNSIIAVSPSCDLTLTKEVNNSNPNYGDIIKWTLTVSNNGPNSASAVVVSDKLPDGLEFISSNGNYQNGVWNVGTLDVNETVALEIVCKVTSAGELTNNADVKSNETDPDLTNNGDSATIKAKENSDDSNGNGNNNNGNDNQGSSNDKKTNKDLEDLLKTIKGDKDLLNHLKDINDLLKTIKNNKDLLNHLKDLIDLLKNIGGDKNPGIGFGNPDDFLKNNNGDNGPSNNDGSSDNHSKLGNGADGSSDSYANKNSANTLGNHSTGNPIAVLLLSMLFSIIFFGKRISNKR